MPQYSGCPKADFRKMGDTMPITAFYASLLAILFLALSFRTISARRAARVALGDGKDAELLRRIRTHANCAEYVPIALILMGLAESLKLPGLALHAIGAVLLAGRVVHAYALSNENLRLRVIGMGATFTAIITALASSLVLSVLTMI